MSASIYLVTTEIRGVSRSLIWNSATPLALGHPLRWVVEKTKDGIRARNVSTTLNQPRSEPVLCLDHTLLAKGGSVKIGALDLHIRQASEPRTISQKLTVLHTDDRDVSAFKRQLQYAFSGFAAFLLIAVLWPKPQVNEELIPAQVAKIILAPTLKSKGNPDAGSAPAPGQTTKAQNTAVAQAFRAKALQNSVSGLLKGGMTRLLAQSDFASGVVPSASAKMFKTNQTGALATAQEIGAMNSKSVLVASLGGAGLGGGTGTSGVGYGKGHKAGVTGQGSSQVSMDLGNSNVEEGLSRDEVGEVIHKHLSEIRYCYESAILRTPGIEGRLIANFVIGGSGQVKTSEIKSSNLPDPRLDDCILRRLATWRFPQTKGGIDVAVSYPFIFKTLGR